MVKPSNPRNSSLFNDFLFYLIKYGLRISSGTEKLSTNLLFSIEIIKIIVKLILKVYDLMESMF